MLTMTMAEMIAPDQWSMVADLKRGTVVATNDGYYAQLNDGMNFWTWFRMDTGKMVASSLEMNLPVMFPVTIIAEPERHLAISIEKAVNRYHGERRIFRERAIVEYEAWLDGASSVLLDGAL